MSLDTQWPESLPLVQWSSYPFHKEKWTNHRGLKCFSYMVLVCTQFLLYSLRAFLAIFLEWGCSRRWGMPGAIRKEEEEEETAQVFKQKTWDESRLWYILPGNQFPHMKKNKSSKVCYVVNKTMLRILIFSHYKTCKPGPLKLETSFLWSSFPGGSDDKESACSAGDAGLIPGSGRSPGEGNLLATHSSILAWRMTWSEVPGRLQFGGRKASDRTERLTFSLIIWIWNDPGS